MDIKLEIKVVNVTLINVYLHITVQYNPHCPVSSKIWMLQYRLTTTKLPDSLLLILSL